MGASSASRVAMLVGGLLGCVAYSQAQSDRADKTRADVSALTARIREQVPRQMEPSNVPGVAVAIVADGSAAWAEGFGQSARSGGEKVTADTLFSVQSVSKTVTATAFLVAVEKGWFKLDDPLAAHLPTFTVKSRFGADEARKITFRHLLSHWSGLTHEAPCGNNYDDRPCPFEEHVRSIADTWLKVPVGERHSYSNLGFDLGGYGLGVVSETQLGTTLLHHEGSGYGYSSLIAWMPEHDVGVVVLTNASEGLDLSRGLAMTALQHLVQTKSGGPPKKAGPPEKPVVAVEPALLKRLEGTYKSSGAVYTFRAQDGKLHCRFDGQDFELSAHGPAEFSFRGRRFVFLLSEAGSPTGVRMFSPSGMELMPLNDRPGEAPGPNKPQWQAFVGEYAARLHGQTENARVFIQNGHVYLNREGDLRLTEFEPGLFFTADGEVVQFEKDRMSVGNIPFNRNP